MDKKKKKVEEETIEPKHEHCKCKNGEHEHCNCNHDECHCGESCECGEDCSCHEHECDCGCEHEESKEAVYLEALQRTMAEFDNFRKRTALSNMKSKEDGVCQTISAILPSVDALDKAMEMCKDNPQVLEGLKLVKENILTAFKNLGLSEIEAINKPFDPNLHNAVVATEEAGVEEGIVLEEYQKGYKLGDRVVRYTMCRVSK